MRRQSVERGAVTLLFALSTTVLLGAGAVAIDLAMLYAKRQALQNAVDAAVTAGAYYLPDTDKAKAAAIRYAKANDPTSNPTVTFACIVGSQLDAAGQPTGLPVTTDIPSSCNPGSYTTPVPCNTRVCVIPCPVTGVCNSIRVYARNVVPFGFARILGVAQGSTGTIKGTACSGTCGMRAINPMDVVFVADRTSSMATADRNLMVQAMKDTLLKMTPSMQFVALATIHRSTATPGTCITTGSSSATSGPWVPVRFVDDYLTAAGAVATTSSLVQGLNCLASSSGGTYLASPLKLAAYYLQNPTLLSSTYTTMQARRTYTPSKAIIFETDGQPNETTIAGNLNINTTDIGNADSGIACKNFQSIATTAKAAGIMIVTVSFGGANTATCGSGSTLQQVRDVLASAATPKSVGVPSAASDCSTAAGRTAENRDGDFFFCAASGSELSSIFTTAVGQISGRSRIIEEF